VRTGPDSPVLLTLLLLLGVALLGLSLQPASAQASGTYTQYTSVIEYSTASGYTPENVNITWANTNTCGSFGFDGPGATWSYGTGVGATPCTSSLPSGTINMTISQGGATLASCVDTEGAATYGSVTPSSGSAPGCTTEGTGVVIAAFSSQAYDASGNPIPASSGNYYWIIALIVVIVLILLLLFYLRRRSRKRQVATSQAGAMSAGASSPPVR